MRLKRWPAREAREVASMGGQREGQCFASREADREVARAERRPERHPERWLAGKAVGHHHPDPT